MKEYFKVRVQSYTYIALGLVIGLFISGFLFGNAVMTAIFFYFVFILFIGELIRFNKWKRNKE